MNFLEKKLKREIEARKLAESILEEKSAEIYSKNKELEHLNKELNTLLSLKKNELQESENERFKYFENFATGIGLVLNGNFFKANSTLLNLFGYSEEEMMDLKIEDITHPDDLQKSLRKIKDHMEGNIDHYIIEKRYIRKNQSYFWAKSYVSTIKNTKGEKKYSLIFIENIHEQKIAQKKTQLLIKELQEINEKLENFAHVISHDLKAPLTGINTILNWMEDPDLSQETHKEYHNLMKDRVEKMYNMIDHIIEYSKVTQESENQDIININVLLDETLQFLNIPLHISIQKSTNFPTIKANSIKIQQIFNNLLTNAIKHIEKPTGIITIHWSETPLLYVFKIRDNGIGIEEKHYSKIFNLFNSLSPQKKSSGIGLNIVQKIVNQYKGTITVNSEIGQFTEFTFTLAKKMVHY
ncbi:histidine kinase [Flavobacteriaceae bacterium UJ101]|nr:histidine kinase [Flavobacteriaceae bacterium UJ101]